MDGGEHWGRRLEDASPRGTWVLLRMDDLVLSSGHLSQSGPRVVQFALSFATRSHHNTPQLEAGCKSNYM